MHTFTVEGHGEFPFDMLRYDSCWPYQNNDALVMAGPVTAPLRRVTLQTNDAFSPHADRWDSFLWHVVREGA